MLVRRKNKIVGKLDLAIEVFAAAFGVELNDIVRHNGFHFMLMMVPHAMHACGGSIAETACHMVVFGAIVELNVPTHRNEEYHKGHQKGTDLQDSFFHGTKVGKKDEWCRFFV